MQEQLLPTLQTVRDWLRFAVSRFRAAQIVLGHGTSREVDEAAFLILATLHLPHDELEPWLDAKLTMAERKKLLEVAIEEGSTIVRVGSAIFGSRPPLQSP